MNRHAASNEMNDRINGESSGGAEWFSRTKSNNSLDASGISLDVIVNLPHDAVVSRRVNSGVRHASHKQESCGLSSGAQKSGCSVE
jgi:hypothetical protein